MKNKTDAEIGLKIKVARIKARMKQKDFAEKLGFSIDQILKYEKGITPITVNRLQQMATILNVNINEILEG